MAVLGLAAQGRASKPTSGRLLERRNLQSRRDRRGALFWFVFSRVRKNELAQLGETQAKKEKALLKPVNKN